MYIVDIILVVEITSYFNVNKMISKHNIVIDVLHNTKPFISEYKKYSAVKYRTKKTFLH